MMRISWLCILMLGACTSGQSAQTRSDAAGAETEKVGSGWMAWHDRKRETDNAVLNALNRPDGGADYPAAIALLERSGRPSGVIDLQVGNTILSAYRDPARAIMPKQSVDEAFTRLERASTQEGESAQIAPADLARWFGKGVGKVKAPDPALARCWESVVAQQEVAATCIGRRSTKG